MANRFYPLGKHAMFSAFLGVTSEPASPVLKAALVRSTYTYSASHNDRADISPFEIATPVALSGVTLVAGLLDADDLVPGFTDVTVGESVGAVIIYVEDGATTYLLMYMDEADITVFPMPVGANRVDVQWHSSGIGRL